MTEITDFALSAARKYLQSVVFVDDKIYYELESKNVVVPAIPNKSMKIFASRPKDDLIEGGGSQGEDVSENGNSQEESIPYHPKNLVESFAKERMVCALYEPAKGFATDSESELFRLCERADVVILDWEFYKEPGSSILPLIAGLVSKSQTTVPHHVRLCAIYTTTPDLKKVASQLYDFLKGENLDVDPEGDFCLRAGSSRLIVLGKPTTGRAKDQADKAEVAETGLASRIISEFASMHEGILPSLALDGLASVRTSTKKILDKFSADMDGAFLVHRGLILPSDDAFDQIPELLAEEALAVMSDNRLSSDLAKRLAEEAIGAKNLAIDWEVKAGRQKPAAGVLANRLLKEGQGKVEKDISVDANVITELHAAMSGQGGKSEKRFAALYNTRTQYSAVKHLGFGTIIRRSVGDNYEYSICLMPLCDSIRLSTAGGRVYQFPFWKLRTDNQKQASKGMVLALPGDEGFVELFSMGKPRDQLWMEGFKAAASKTVAANEQDGKSVFQGEAIQLEWIAQLKPSHAQRIAHEIGTSFSRVGVIEAEWIRIIAERQR